MPVQKRGGCVTGKRTNWPGTQGKIKKFEISWIAKKITPKHSDCKRVGMSLIPTF
jgi:hypothetical protein